MSQAASINRLDRSVDDSIDHILGPGLAQITLVEYGSYACPYCRAANERIAEVRDQLGERLRYVFRHRPLTDSDIALRAAVLVERAPTIEQFWAAHIKLMTRSQVLSEDDLEAVARDLGLADLAPERAAQEAARAAARVESDIASSHASGVRFTPSFFINERRYDGPWDESSFLDAMLGTLGHRFRAAALDFASWGPSAGILLLLATILAIALTNSPLGPGFEAFWHRELALSFGDARFGMSVQHWVNDGLLTIFFLVVGLEIKREFTVGHLAGRRSAALPIAGAIGGMVVPAALYMLVLPGGPWSHGWGVPMATDTAFAIAIIAMMGSRVPIELRIFLTAAAIVDDIGAIIVVALFYSGKLQLGYLLAALILTGALAALNRSHIYRVAPYALIGIALWICVYTGGLHATLAGVVLALFIPTRPPADLTTLTAQANSIMQAEAAHGAEILRHGPSTPALRALDAIHDRLESPADRLLRHAVPVRAMWCCRFSLSPTPASSSRPMSSKAAGCCCSRSWRGSYSASHSACSAPPPSPCASASRPSRRTIPGFNSPARARSPESASPCRSSSPARPFSTTATSPLPRSPCSPPRSALPCWEPPCSGMPHGGATATARTKGSLPRPGAAIAARRNRPPWRSSRPKWIGRRLHLTTLSNPAAVAPVPDEHCGTDDRARQARPGAVGDGDRQGILRWSR